jgi:CRP-like cAMP-binding protein
MIEKRQPGHPMPSAFLRLSRLAPLENTDLTALIQAALTVRTARVRSELVVEGAEVAEPRIVLSGWAARVRLLADGRRQLLSFVLPGDLIGMCQQPRPLAVSTIAALTEVTFCMAPPADGLPHLARAYAVSRALEEAYLLCHITRLGRMNAHERIGDLFLELHERLDLAGLVEDGRFDLPLTQETLGDVLGLTAVHINRVLQTMRREREIAWKSGRLTMYDPLQLAQRVGRSPVRVSADA